MNAMLKTLAEAAANPALLQVLAVLIGALWGILRIRGDRRQTTAEKWWRLGQFAEIACAEAYDIYTRPKKNDSPDGRLAEEEASQAHNIACGLLHDVLRAEMPNAVSVRQVEGLVELAYNRLRAQGLFEQSRRPMTPMTASEVAAATSSAL